MNAFHQDRFLVGTTFAPTALATDIPPSEWEKDVATMKALGLNKLNDVRELPDNPSVRGLIAQVYYLVRVEE